MGEGGLPQRGGGQGAMRAVIVWLLLLGFMSSAAAVEVTWVGGGHAANPTWSADGRWLTFEVSTRRGVRLYLARITGGTPAPPQRISVPGLQSTDRSNARGAAWHPKGAAIFEAGNLGGVTRLYSLTPGGSSPMRLLGPSEAAGDVGQPALSPDGRSLAFIWESTGCGDLVVYDMYNGGSAVHHSTGADFAPTFTPDGHFVVYTSLTPSGVGVFMIDAGLRGASNPVVNPLGDQVRPRVVGTNVLYFTNERDPAIWDLAQAPLNGGRERTILARDIQLPTRSAPAVLPDGSAALYTLADGALDDRVYATRLDGGGTTEIRTGLSAVRDPAIAIADGRAWLAFTALPALESDWRQLHMIDVTDSLLSVVGAAPAVTGLAIPAPAVTDAAPRDSGVLHVLSDPDGASVYVNEQARGTTPLAVELPYGTYRLRVVLAGFKTEIRDAGLRVGDYTVPFKLKPEMVTGQVNVYAPQGYRLVVDGHDIGPTPVTVQVSEGTRQFTLVAEDGSGCTIPRQITFVAPGMPVTITLQCP